jgi:excisionase family DNA binding protein
MADLQSPVPRGEYITRKAVADDYGLTTRTVDNAIRDGRLKAYKFGRTVRLRRSEVQSAFVPMGAA